MPRKIRENGMILVICPNCRRVYNMYELLSKSSKEKYMGSPVPRRGIQKFDLKVNSDGTFKCLCGAILSIKPERVFVMKYKEFLEHVYFDAAFIRPKVAGSIGPVSLDDVMSHSGINQEDDEATDTAL